MIKLAFVAVVEAGSISRVAMTLHVAQPALSQQTADLEERTGVQLDRIRCRCWSNRRFFSPVRCCRNPVFAAADSIKCCARPSTRPVDTDDLANSGVPWLGESSVDGLSGRHAEPQGQALFSAGLIVPPTRLLYLKGGIERCNTLDPLLSPVRSAMVPAWNAGNCLQMGRG
jgi:hypothetical protein